jgi:hypothetical protein
MFALLDNFWGKKGQMLSFTNNGLKYLMNLFQIVIIQRHKTNQLLKIALLEKNVRPFWKKIFSTFSKIFKKMRP